MRDPLRGSIGRTVVAHLGGVSIRGTLRSVSRSSVVLDPAEALREDGSAQALDGRAVVSRAGSWFQPDAAPPRVPAAGLKVVG